MYLSSIRLRNLGPFDDETFTFVDPDGAPRLSTVILGDSGSGKTTLLAAIAHTRPGLAATPPRIRSDAAPGDAFAVARYRLGEDDAARPHDLVIASPSADLRELPVDATARKREQAHFDKIAQERGFCVVPLSAGRWASRLPAGSATPDRPISAMDQRAQAMFDDAGRADLARELKQGLVQAMTVAALTSYQATERARSDAGTSLPPTPRVFSAMHDVFRSVFSALSSEAEVLYEGVDPQSFEPLFRDAQGRLLAFDDLGFGLKNRLLLGGILIRRIAIAYPGRDPRDCEAVALIDEIEAHLPQQRQREIINVLRGAFPRLQIIATTQSPLCLEGRAHDEVIVLSRDLESGAIEVSGGPSAVLH